jgi:hypothetical protein
MDQHQDGKHRLQNEENMHFPTLSAAKIRNFSSAFKRCSNEHCDPPHEKSQQKQAPKPIKLSLDFTPKRESSQQVAASVRGAKKLSSTSG